MGDQIKAILRWVLIVVVVYGMSVATNILNGGNPLRSLLEGILVAGPVILYAVGYGGSPQAVVLLQWKR